MDDRAYSEIGLYVLGNVIPLAIFGNILTIIVFHKGLACRASKTSIYFKALAIVDIYVLLFPCMELFLACLPTPIVYRNLNTIACKFAAFNLYFAVDVSTWITVVVTLDRTLSVCFPFKFQNLTKAKWIRVKLATIVLLSVLFNTHTLYYYQIYDSSTENVLLNITETEVYCLPSGRTPMILDALNMTVFIFGLPLVSNVTCNIFLLRKLYKRASKYENPQLTHMQLTARNALTNSITKRVVAISLVHLISTAPFAALHIYTVAFDSSDFTDTVYWVDRILNILYYMNSAVNFYLFCATGSDFRRDLCLMFSCKFKNRNVNLPFHHPRRLKSTLPKREVPVQTTI